MKYSRKSEIQSNVFIYIFVAIVILLLLIFAFVSIRNARERAAEIEQKKLEKEISDSLQEIEYGSVERKQLNVPAGTKEICFIDITKRSEMLTSPILQAEKYKRMKSIIQSGEKKNIFFFLQKEPYLTAIYQAGICFDHYPYFSCLEPRATILNLYIEGKGSCALIVMEYKVCEKVVYDATDPTKTKEEVSLGSIYAKLTIPAETQLTPNPPEICIEATSYIGAEGLISEVYNITPAHIISSQKVTFDLRYEHYLLPPNINPTQHIKLKKSSSPWILLDNPAYDIDNNRVSGKTTELSYVAVFGPESPTANIKNEADCEQGDIIQEGTELVVSKDTNVNFCSASIDPDDDIITYSWDFGDDKTGSGATVTNKYTELGSYNLTLTVTDSTGYKDTITIIVTVVNDNNQKNPDRDDTILLISNPSHYSEILRLVPVAMWKSSTPPYDRKIPYLVYHTEGVVSSTHFNIAGLKNKYGATKKIDLFTNEPVLNTELSINHKESTKDAQSTQSLIDYYFNYWSKYEDIVVVGYDNQNAALMASLFAAFINAPIIFINDANKANYETALNKPNLHAYIIDSLDAGSESLITSKPVKQTRYNLNDLKNPTKNQYQTLKSKIVLTT